MKPLSITFLFFLVYATLRYNVFKGVPWSDWFLYTTNKALAISALAFIVISIIQKRFSHYDKSIQSLNFAFFSASLHVLFSFMLLRPEYYGNLFNNGKITLFASISMIIGGLTFYKMINSKFNFKDRSVGKSLISTPLIALMIGIHAALQGYQAWFKPLEWPAMMPPITMISFILGLVGLYYWISDIINSKKNPSINNTGKSD